jgi:hypothetical protein
MNEIMEQAKELGINVYERRPDQDILISRWWESLVESGEINLVATRSGRSLSGFFSMLGPPRILLYTGEEFIDLAVWFEKAGTSDKGYYFSTWTDESIRGTRKQVRTLHTIYEGLFKFADVLVGITKQKELLGIHRKVGYVYGCAVPYLFDNEPAYVVYLTKSGYRAGKMYSMMARNGGRP